MLHMYNLGLLFVTVFGFVVVFTPLMGYYEDNTNEVKFWLITTAYMNCCVFLFIYFMNRTAMQTFIVLIVSNLYISVWCMYLFNTEMGPWATYNFRLFFIPCTFMTCYYTNECKYIGTKYIDGYPSDEE